MFLDCCIELIKILLLHWTLEDTKCANEQIESQVLPLGDYQMQLWYKSTFFVLMMHINTSSHISKTIMHQVFVLFVPANSTDILVKAIEHQKNIYRCRFNSIIYCLLSIVYGSFISVLEKNIWHSTLFKSKTQFCPGVLTSEEMIYCCSFSIYFKEHSLKHTEIYYIMEVKGCMTAWTKFTVMVGVRRVWHYLSQ